MHRGIKSVSLVTEFVTKDLHLTVKRINRFGNFCLFSQKAETNTGIYSGRPMEQFIIYVINVNY